MMGQYDSAVEKQRLILLAEEKANEILQIHSHKLTSMYYETEESIKDHELGGVIDTNYMDGRIERTRADGTKYVLVEGKKGEELIAEVQKHLTDSGERLE